MVYFDSRDTRCKSPAGARPAGSVVEFKFYISDALEVDYVNLKLRGKGVLTFKLLKSDEALGDKRAYAGRVTVPAPGLYRYRFELVHPDGSMHFCGTVDGFSAVVADWLDEWYFTAFMPSFDTPVAPGAIMYQIFPDRFCNGTPEENTPDIAPWHAGPVTNQERFGGNLKGIEEKLPYLKELGITGIYLNPIMEADSTHKYDTKDYTRIDPQFGTNEDFARLVKKAHEYGIRIMVDAVFNH